MLQKIDLSQAIQTARENLRQSITALDSAGPAPSFTVPPSCPICAGVTWVYPDVDRNDPYFGKAVPCKCRLQSFEERRRASLMKFCNLPDGADEKTMDNYKVNPGLEYALESALDLLAGKTKFLSFIGRNNVGKTHLAIALCHEYIDLGIPAKFYSCGIFLRDLRATFDRDSVESYRKVVERAYTVPLLVLDDFYQGKRSEWMEDELENLVDKRYLAKLPTVFTTNVPLAGMSVRIASRLQRESWCRVVVIG